MHQPDVLAGETLNSQYALKKWSLPACGILKLIYGFYHASRNKTNNALPSASYADEDNTVADADYPLMSNVLARYTAAGLDTSSLHLGSNSIYWSATEYISSNAWYVNFSDGYVYNYYGKHYAYVVRPVVAFTLNV